MKRKYHIEIGLFILFIVINHIACSSIDTIEETIENNTTELHSGSVYFACDFGPYSFSLDSLLANCSQEGSLIDSITSDYISNINFNSAPCTYDGNPSLANENWDFKIARDGTGNTFGIEWQSNNFNTNPTNASIDGNIHEEQEYPFYNGMEIELEGNRKLSLLFFNVYIGGCFHDLMVWELEE